jgi:hypothetical protein
VTGTLALCLSKQYQLIYLLTSHLLTARAIASNGSLKKLAAAAQGATTVSLLVSSIEVDERKTE